MRLLGNILWFILGGWWSFLLYGFLGVVFCITIIGIPIGKSLFQYAKLMAFPFGKVIVRETDIKGKENVSAIRRVGGVIANILWLPLGIITFIGSIGVMLICFISIILIPVGVVIAKSCTFLLWPIGAKVITKEEAEAIRMTNAMKNAMGGMNQVNMNAAAPSVMAASATTPVIPAETPVVVASMGQNTVQNTAQAQPNPTLENLKTGGTQMFDNIKESGGKAATVIAETSGKAATVIAETGAEGMEALKKRQLTASEQVLAKEQAVSMEDMLVQMEVKLYRNQIMAWIMPFLEYITIFFAVVVALIGVFRYRHLVVMGMQMAGFASFSLGFTGIIRGFLSGITTAAPVLLVGAVLGMIKRNHTYVLAVLGTELLAHVLLAFLRGGFDFWSIVCYAGIMVWYVLTAVKKTDFKAIRPQGQAMASTGTAGAGNAPFVKNFCSQCGAECPEGVSFCPKCGHKQK